MATNPIKASDLYKDDGAIKAAIKDLEKMEQVIVSLQEKTKQESANVAGALKKVTVATAKGREEVVRHAKKIDELARSEERYKKALSETGTKIRQLREVQQSLLRQRKLEEKVTREAAGSYNQLSAQYSLNKLRLNAMSDAERKSTKTGRELEKETRKIYERMNQLQRATGKAQLGVGRYEMAGRKLVGTLSMMAGGYVGVYGTVMLFRNAINTLVGFEKSMSAVKAISGATGDEFEQLKNKAIELGTYTSKTAIEVSKLQLEYAKIGFSTKEILDATDATVMLSQATGEDLAKSAEVAGATIRGFGMDASETGRVVDVMAKSFTSSALNLDRFANSMTYIAPIAKASGLTLEQTTAALSALADAGIHGSMAGTAMRRMLSQFAKDGKPFEEQIRRLAKAGLTLAGANDEVGMRAQTALLILSKNIDKIDRLTDSYNHASGAAKEMADIQMDNLAGSLTYLSSAWDSLMLKFQKSNGWLRENVDFITAIINAINRGIKEKEPAKLFDEEGVVNAVELAKKSLPEIKKFQEQFKNQAKEVFGTWKNYKEAGNKEAADYVAGQYDILKQNEEIAQQVYIQRKKELDRKAELEKQKAEQERKQKEREANEAKRKAALEAQKRLQEYRKERDLKISVMADGEEKEKALLAATYEDKKAEFKKYGIDTVNLDKWYQLQLAKIDKKWADKLAKDKADADKKALDDARKKYQTELKDFDNEQKIEKIKFNLIKHTAVEKERFTLEAEKKRLKKILELNLKYGKQLSDSEIELIKKEIAAIDKELSELDSGENKSKDIYDLLGFKLNDKQKQAISQATRFAMEQVRQLMQARVDAANAAVDAAEREKQAAKDNLDTQIALSEKGYANNVKKAAKEYEAKKKLEEKALKERQKIVRQQILLEGALQAVNLITATTGIFKSFASLGPWGIPLAIAMSAVMWGAFFASKAKAIQATKYGRGGEFEIGGGSHESGHDTSLGVHGGKERKVERGEKVVVFNKKAVAKYGDDISRFAKMINGQTIEKQTKELFTISEIIPISGYDSPDLRRIEDELSEINNRGRKRTYIDGSGHLIEEYKNLKRVYV